jgi:hypothetical protein
MDDLSARFISAYNEIDHFLRRLAGQTQQTPFMQILRLCAVQ